MKTGDTHSLDSRRKISQSLAESRKANPSGELGTACRIIFGRPHHTLTPDERVVFKRYMRKISYYRRYAANMERQRNQKRDIRPWLLEQLGWKAECMDCGYNKHIAALDFHHIVPSDKEDTVLVLPREKALEEARKCRLVCSNCHRAIHYGQRREDSGAGRPRQDDPILDALLDAYGISR